MDSRYRAVFPDRLKSEVEHLTDEQLDTPYRPEGWSIRQVVHHCADSHTNAITRFKLALTEDNPIIKPYLEDKWAELIDCKTLPIDSSIKTLEGIHHRWAVLLNTLNSKQLERTYFIPNTAKNLL